MNDDTPPGWSEIDRDVIRWDRLYFEEYAESYEEELGQYGEKGEKVYRAAASSERMTNLIRAADALRLLDYYQKLDDEAFERITEAASDRPYTIVRECKAIIAGKE